MVGSRVKKRRPSRTRRGLPPGPSDLEPKRTPHRTRLFEDLLVPLTVLALLTGLINVPLVFFEMQLDLDHQTAVGRIEQLQAGNHSGGPEARVVFPIPGSRQADATIDRSLGGDTLRVGDRIRIEYRPSDPRNARRAGTHSVACFPVALASVIYLAFVPRLWSRRRRRREAKVAR